ncbi:MAG: ATP-binding cassette domain-containing protein [Egibacteraceae bacterium]
MTVAIQAQGLTKTFGETRALDGIDLDVRTGTVLGLLGPNGSGKTTAVRIFATLLQPTSGRASVAGYDVARQAAQVRGVIGLTGQTSAVDDHLTGFENLELIGRLLNLSRLDARRRAHTLLEHVDLADAAGRLAKTYSGGMRRRLDLAASIVGRPSVLFLDEPTAGLDPRSRIALWDTIRRLVADGTTVLLTTQYLEEADQIADQIAVLDHGQIIARGTADELKEQTGGQRLEIRPHDPSRLDDVAAALAALTGGVPAVDRDAQLVGVAVDDTFLIAAAVRRLDDAGIAVADLALRRPSLDDVFLHLTGHKAEPAPSTSPQPQGGRRKRRKAA